MVEKCSRGVLFCERRVPNTKLACNRDLRAGGSLHTRYSDWLYDTRSRLTTQSIPGHPLNPRPCHWLFRRYSEPQCLNWRWHRSGSPYPPASADGGLATSSQFDEFRLEPLQWTLPVLPKHRRCRSFFHPKAPFLPRLGFSESLSCRVSSAAAGANTCSS